MSKSIYERAREILLNMGTEFISIPCNPIGEENSDMIHLRDVTETYETNMHEVVKALEQAQKQEKLLELYKEINNKSKELITLSRHNTWSWKLDVEIKEIQDKIKELENDK